MTTIRCKPWGEGQGDFVLVDADKFDPAFHVDLAAPAPEPEKVAKAQKAAKADTKTED